jgi:hypothetical protein
VTRRRTIATLIAVAVLATAALGRVSSPRADEEEEKPITSGAARISRDPAGHVFIVIRPAVQKEIGLTIETLKRAVRPIEAEAYGFVLDPAPLSTLNSDLVSARAALDASRAQYRRTRRLYAEQKNASLRDLQSAQAAYLGNRARVETLEHQVSDRWGREIAQMNSRARGELVRALIDRREAIARVTAPVGVALDSAPHRATVVVLGHEAEPLDARAVYSAPAVVATMQGQAFLLLMATRKFPVRPGIAVTAHIPASGGSEQGVMVPRSAVVRYAGGEWVYCELDGDRFVRREIVPAEITRTGYFVTKSLTPGMRVVAAGAQALLSEELKAQIQRED